MKLLLPLHLQSDNVQCPLTKN